MRRLTPLIIQRTYHNLQLLSLSDLKRLSIKTDMYVYAKGVLLGQFYEDIQFSFSKEQMFLGNFQGFFERKYNNQYRSVVHFEGTINKFQLISIKQNQIEQNEDQSIFKGYFIGNFYTIVPKLEKINIFLHQNLRFYVNTTREYYIPTFVRFLIKKIANIHIEESKASVEGNMIIEIQLTKYTFDLIQSKVNMKKKIYIEFNKDKNIGLPLYQGTFCDDDCNIQCQFKGDNVIGYVIRKQFLANIDSSYEQFFAPFNSNTLKIVVSLIPLVLVDQKENTDINLNFCCGDLDDSLSNKKFTPYNKLFSENEKDKLLSRLTKINFIDNNEAGQYRIDTNFLQLYPYYSSKIRNSSYLNTSFRWAFGFINRKQFLSTPTIKSIQEQIQNHVQQLKSKGILALDEIHNKQISILRLPSWNYVHVEIPIHKYIVLNMIQIFVPLFILSVIGILIFVQQSGKNVDGFPVLNARIINVASIMIAYTTLIPMIRQNTPKTTFLTLVYIIIYVSAAPHFLSLVHSVKNENIDTKAEIWKSEYTPFKEYLFLIALIIQVIAYLLLVLLCIKAYKRQTSIYSKIPLTRYKKIEQILKPKGYHQIIESLKFKRKNQFNIIQYREEPTILIEPTLINLNL